MGTNGKTLRPWFALACGLPLLACGSMPEPRARTVRSFLEARQDRMVVQKWDLSCGAAALATILTYQHGDPVTEREVARSMLRQTNVELVRQRLGFSLLDLKRYAQGRGFAADGYGGLTFDDLRGFGPTIVPVQIRGFPHFVVFRGVQGDRVLLADPAFGNRTMRIAAFEDIWQNRIGFTIRRTDDLPPPNYLAVNSNDFWASSLAFLPPSELPGEAPTALAAAEPAPAPAPPAVEVAALGTPGPEAVAPPRMARRTTWRGARPEQSQPAAPLATGATPASEPAAVPAAIEPAATEPVAPEPVAPAPPATPPPASALLSARSAAPVPPGPMFPGMPSTGTAPTAAAPAAATREPASALLRRGDALMLIGDISGARRFYERAAGHDGAAARALGETYDPGVLAELGARGLQPDVAVAEAWYRKALALGDPQAAARMQHLQLAGIR